jgi:hypothetical protein
VRRVVAQACHYRGDTGGDLPRGSHLASESNRQQLNRDLGRERAGWRGREVVLVVGRAGLVVMTVKNGGRRVRLRLVMMHRVRF